MNRNPESRHEKFEIRNPRSEGSPKTELRSEGRALAVLFGLRISDVFRPSTFGFRNLPRMRLGTVIGRVTLSRAAPALTGARWLIVSPFTRDHFQHGVRPPSGLSREPSLVIYDALGGDQGQTIGFVEGREAAQPLDPPAPVDAISAALVDEVFYSPYP